LGQIAKNELGMPSQCTAVFEANRDQLDDPDKIKPGRVLKLPASVSVRSAVHRDPSQS
jgi:nucleoid-associated protein YgaU